jgi:Na+-transporting NADH:ubiquinone oxidoreductase subunit C
MYSGLKETHDNNELLFEKRAILSAVQNYLDKNVADMSDNEVAEVFSSMIKQEVINSNGEFLNSDQVIKSGYRGGKAENIKVKVELAKPAEKRILPLFIFKDSKANEYFVIRLLGKGLWDEISGYLALEKDKNTVAGASFDHKSETPGMGAEMKDNPQFKTQFEGKKIFDNSGKMVSIKVVKGGAKDKEHDVDAISGATLTSDGITNMLSGSLTAYEAYLKKSVN